MNLKWDKGQYLVFDTETTEILNNNYTYKIPETCPRILQIAWNIYDKEHNLKDEKNYYVKTDIQVSDFITKLTGIDNKILNEKGIDIKTVIHEFETDLQLVDYVIAHNFNYDRNIVGAEYKRLGLEDPFIKYSLGAYCTMENTKYVLKIRNKYGSFKRPNLSESYSYFYKDKIDFHKANNDIIATQKVFKELKYLLPSTIG